MPDIVKEAGLPDNWHPVDVPAINPAQPLSAPPLPNKMDSYFQGSLSPTMQHDAVFVGTQYGSPSVPNIALMPVAFSGTPSFNSAVKSAVGQAVAVAAAAVTPTDTDYIGINKQAGTSYTIQLSDFDTIVSMSNNSGGTVLLPLLGESLAPVPAFVQGSGTDTTTPPSATITPFLGSAGFSSANKAGNTILVLLNLVQLGGPPFPDPIFVVSVSDTQGNVYSQVSPPAYVRADSSNMFAFVAQNIVGGASNIITATVSSGGTGGSVKQLNMDIVEYAGSPLAPPLESHNSQGQVLVSGGTSSVGYTLTTLYPNDLIILTGEFWNVTTPPAGFVSRGPYGSSGIGYFEKTIQTPITATYTSTITGSNTTHTGQLGIVISALGSPGSAALPPFPKGWYCYIENTGSGTFNVTPQGNMTIDGVAAPVALGQNQGLILIFDGANWLTERGIGGSGGGTDGGTWNVVSKTSAYNAVAGDMVVCDTTSAGFVVTIPLAASNPKKSIRIKKISSDLNAVTPTASGSDMIDGQTTQPFNGQETDMEITSDGVSNWWIV
jgi:hypothetical protein